MYLREGLGLSAVCSLGSMKCIAECAGRDRPKMMAMIYDGHDSHLHNLRPFQIHVLYLLVQMLQSKQLHVPQWIVVPRPHFGDHCRL